MPAGFVELVEPALDKYRASLQTVSGTHDGAADISGGHERIGQPPPYGG
jgi:hypothetical protein